MKTLKSIITESKENEIMENVNNNEVTIKELYEWAVKNKCTDYKIIIQYRDEGGEYFGCDEEIYLTINKKDKTVIL